MTALPSGYTYDDAEGFIYGFMGEVLGFFEDVKVRGRRLGDMDVSEALDAWMTLPHKRRLRMMHEYLAVKLGQK